jgi:hypothetical protein
MSGPFPFLDNQIKTRYQGFGGLTMETGEFGNKVL